MSDNGYVRTNLSDGIAAIEFFHPKKNSLPGTLLADAAAAIDAAGRDPEARVVVLRSGGEGPFCAGASFDELLAIRTADQGTDFFMGFARLILAMRACPKFVVVRLQGKAVGGGVGVAAAADYALATEGAAIKLSEFALGFGPFVIGPAVERKMGVSAFSAMAIDTDWRSAHWAGEKGLYNRVLPSVPELDAAVDAFAAKLAATNPEAMAKLKAIFWRGTRDWETVLPERARMSGELVLSEFTSAAIDAFRRG